MAIEYHGAGAENATFVSSDTVSANKPGSLTNGMFLFVVGGCHSDYTINTPDGYSRIIDVVHADNTSGHMSLFYRVVDGTEPAEVSITTSSSGTAWRNIFSFAYKATAGETMTVGNSDGNRDTSTPYTWNGINALTESDVLVCYAGMNGPEAVTPDALCSERFQGSGAVDANYVMDQQLSASGATGTRSATTPGGTTFSTITFTLYDYDQLSTVPSAPTNLVLTVL